MPAFPSALGVPSAFQELGQVLGHTMSQLSLCASAPLGGVRLDSARPFVPRSHNHLLQPCFTSG